MSWTDLPTNYTDAVWSGLRKYALINNDDGTVSFNDVTVYTQKENSFFGAADANAMNAAMNKLAENMDTVAEKVTIATQKATEAANSATAAANSASSASESATAAQSSATKVNAMLFDNAGAHNAIYRGKNLGTSVTSAQWVAIANGTFTDMYIGDYWIINDFKWRIAAFDYYLTTGDNTCDTHHVVIVPDTPLYYSKMNITSVTSGGYTGSALYTSGMEQAKTIINTAFGSEHILSHRQFLCNAVSDGKPSGASWYDSTVELMTEQNVYGGKIFGAGNDGSTVPGLYTIDKSQFPLFAHDPSMITNQKSFWLRDVTSTKKFARVTNLGLADSDFAGNTNGVRPAFSIKS